MEVERTTKERERAYTGFTDIAAAHNSALAALNLLTTLPNVDELIAAQLKLLVAGARDDVTFADMATESASLVENAKLQRTQGFSTLRAMSLIALCGAFEYLLKAVLVDQAAYDPDRASDLVARSKVKLSAAEVIGLTPAEQWYEVADRLFASLAEGFPLAHQRSNRMLLEFVHLPLGKMQKDNIETALTPDESRKFNEAFLIRNCLVHNGGRISSALARYSSLQRGLLITLNKEQYGALRRPIMKLATHINQLYLVL